MWTFLIPPRLYPAANRDVYSSEDTCVIPARARRPYKDEDLFIKLPEN